MTKLDNFNEEYRYEVVLSRPGADDMVVGRHKTMDSADKHAELACVQNDGRDEYYLIKVIDTEE